MFTRSRRQRGPRRINLDPLLAKLSAKLDEWQRVSSCDAWREIGRMLLMGLGYAGLGILAYLLIAMGLAM